MPTRPALLDTDTLSEVIKGRDNYVRQHAKHYLLANGPFRFSVLTRYEILRGLKARQAVRQIATFEQRCRASQVFAVTDEIVAIATDIYALLHQRGQLIGDADILIAATALHHGLILVTENRAHFDRVPSLAIESWRSQ
jgi:tRNA(fMet)-specific endonuclease VapC